MIPPEVPNRGRVAVVSGGGAGIGRTGREASSVNGQVLGVDGGSRPPG